MKIFVLILLYMFVVANSVLAGPILDKAKEVAGSAADIVSETAADVGSAIKGEEDTPDEARRKIDNMAFDALDRLMEESPEAKRHFDAAAGYAVFDSRRMSLLIATGFGQGVAVDRVTGDRVYMNMATGGLNLGMGVQFVQVVFLFPSESSYRNFVTKGWDAGADADAVAGKDAENLGLRLPDGTRVYKLNDKGIMLAASLTGTRYWLSEELNQGLE